MAGISFGGINTGLPSNLVQQIIQAERIPLQNLERKNAKAAAKLDLVEALEDKVREVQKSLKELAGTGGFRSSSLQSSDPGIVTGTVDPTQAIANGSYSIEVVQLAQKASAITNGFEDKDSVEVGIGYLEFETDEGTKEVYIDGDNNTLSGVAKAINQASIGMRASVIKDSSDAETPYRLVLSGEGVGADGNIEYPTVYFLDGDQDFFFDEEREAKNGLVKIDGFEFEISDNQIDDFIPGVTINLRNASPGKTVTLDVQEDLEVVSGKIEEFVAAVNGVLGFLQKQSAVDGNTDTSQTLGGDSMIRSVANRFRRLIQGQQLGVGSISRLSQIGISYNRNGTVEFDKEKFNATLAKDPEAVEQFFTGDRYNTGLIPSMKNMTKTLLDVSFGVISNRKRGIQQKIKQANKQIERKEVRLEKKEESLKRKFSKLEQTMSRLKAQGGQLAAMGGGGGMGALNLGGLNT